MRDEENQTAYLDLPQNRLWWRWYDNEIETQAAYLKLLVSLDPKGEATSGLAKYLINNRKHATYWNSTRDTAFCLEALADFVRASGEIEPNMTVEVLIDGQAKKEIVITPDNLFTFDNLVQLTGKSVKTGKHEVVIRRKGAGPLYYNAYLTTFSLRMSSRHPASSLRSSATTTDSYRRTTGSTPRVTGAVGEPTGRPLQAGKAEAR